MAENVESFWTEQRQKGAAGSQPVKKCFILKVFEVFSLWTFCDGLTAPLSPPPLAPSSRSFLSVLVSGGALHFWGLCRAASHHPAEAGGVDILKCLRLLQTHSGLTSLCSNFPLWSNHNTVLHCSVLHNSIHFRRPAFKLYSNRERFINLNVFSNLEEKVIRLVFDSRGLQIESKFHSLICRSKSAGKSGRASVQSPK